MSATTTDVAAGPVVGWDGQPLVIPDYLPGAAWAPRFPTGDQVDLAADFLPGLNRARSATLITGDQVERSSLRDAETELRQVLTGVGLYEGPSWRITVTPGKVKVWTRDEARRDRTENRQNSADSQMADMLAAFVVADGDVPDEAPVRGTISEWSRKSQTRMREAFLDLDYGPWMANHDRPLAMQTVTYPGCWLAVAPDSATVMKHLEILRKRYERAFGEPLYAIWKKEFQGRRAQVWCRCQTCGDRDDGRVPHVHMLVQPPTTYADGSPCNYRSWLLATWAAIVDHPDTEQRRRHGLAGTAVDFGDGQRCTDPRRTADYFAKHSGGSHGKKAYQHKVPAAWEDRPGRFWGYWGLQKKTATVEVTPETGTDAGRIVRRYSKAQQVTRRVLRPRTPGGRPVSKYPEVIGLAGAQLVQSRPAPTLRGSRIRAIRAKNGRGWLSLNNGPDFAYYLGVALRQTDDQRQADAVREELENCGRWDTPEARARRLAPGPRRDALLARLTERAEQARPVEWIRYPDPPVRITDSARPTSKPRCSRCGGKLSPVLAAHGRHIGDCLDLDDQQVLASTRARELEMQ